MSVTKLIKNEIDEHLNVEKNNNSINSNYEKLVKIDIFTKNMEIINRRLSKNRRRRKIFENEKNQKILKICKNVLIDKNRYVLRLCDEFTLIEEFGFHEVFLQVCEILYLSKDIPHIIRGSAGSCLLCYLLGITDIDPIKEKITLSRFMHELRDDIPDIDIDFPAHLRDEIYKKIFNNWEGQVARISNHIMYAEKSAFREAIRQKGYRKFVPRDYNLENIFDDKKIIEEVKKIAKKLIGNFRCYSLHCGGIIIFRNKVPDNLYLKNFMLGSKKNENKFEGTQIWMNKDQVEDAGMIKIDVLSNRGISQLMCISNKPIDDYPMDDKVFKLFADGDNIGITHAESRGMRKIFMTLKPNSIKDLAIALALIRPAASKNYQKSIFLKDYTMYKTEKTRSKYIIFDDDATIYIQKLIDCKISDADNFRRAFSKNKIAKKKEFFKLLRTKRKNLSYEEIQDIKTKLEQLRYYSFCKSHAYSYAKLIYALAYNKVYNPKKFWLATLNQCNTSYRKWVHFREAYKAGYKLTLGKKPWISNNDELKSMNKRTKDIVSKNKKDDYFKYGFWVGKFFENMYYKEYWTPLTAKHTRARSENFTIINNKNIKYAKFKGIVATGRVYKKDGSRGFITFVTICSDDGCYHDLVIYGINKVSKMFCLSGYGKLKYDGNCKWIDVLKLNYEYI